MTLLLVAGGRANLSAQAPTCPAPVAWHITDLDERFGLTRIEAADAVRQAGMLWSSATGDPFLFPESVEGAPIRFVFDHRQERILERRERHAKLDSEARGIPEAEVELNRLREEHDRQREVLDILQMDFQGRWDENASTVAAWNQGGGAPPGELAHLAEVRNALEGEQASLAARAEALNELVGQVNRETERVNNMIAELNQAREAFQADASVPGELPAEYRESRRTFGPFFVSLTREIDVFQFDDRDELVLILARQLGYALGLKTSEVPGAVMSPDTVRGPGEEPLRLDPSDEVQVQQLCVRR
ncbi:MAG: hypothetical protein EXR92_06495 [Gemmatimonadetes bacterium]|nr:hypothetical protein [Gemmatimonadota bacterium]